MLTCLVNSRRLAGRKINIFFAKIHVQRGSNDDNARPAVFGKCISFHPQPHRYSLLSPISIYIGLGYARVVLAVIAMYTMPNQPYQCVFYYGLSAVLDAFDGLAARRFNQGNHTHVYGLELCLDG